MKHGRTSRGGFTLLELTVAAVVGVLVLGGALAVVVNALAWQERSEGHRQAQATAERVLDRLALDLAGFCPGAGSGVDFAATIQEATAGSGLWAAGEHGQPAGAVSVSGEDPAKWRFGIGGVWLRFGSMVSGPENDGGAQPRVVAYQIIRRVAPGDASARYWLHRANVRAGARDGRPGSWEAGWDLDPGTAGAYMNAGTANDGSTVGDPHGVVRPAAAENLFAAGVVDLGVRVLAPAADGAWRVDFPATPAQRQFLHRSSDPDLGTVEVLVRVLTPEGVRRLSAFEEGATGAADGDGWWEIVRANSLTATRRVSLRGGEP
jgi:type II secretory pathway pseudopilin PulG